MANTPHKLLMDRIAELVEEQVQSYRADLILHLQQGYEDSSYRLSEFEEADVLHLIETDSLEAGVVEKIQEGLVDLVSLYLEEVTNG
jgi:hypothetical protein